MNRFTRLAAMLAFAVALGTLALPASAQYATEYVPAKLLHEGTTSHAIAGSGTVVVQVQVFANGSHKTVGIVRSNNHKDDAAALDIASTSSYRPAHRGKTRLMTLYDFTLRFKGSSLSTSSDESVASNSTVAQIDDLIHHGKYGDAKARVETALAHDPNDALLNEELGTSDYFLADYTGAAAAFDKVTTISKTFAQVAAQTYALAAVKTSNAQDAVAYGQKAVALQPDSNTYYALGHAQINAGTYASAVSSLKKALGQLQADPKSDKKTIVDVASELYEAYSKSGDSTGAAQTLGLIKGIDPGNTTVATLEGNKLVEAGNTASQAANQATDAATKLLDHQNALADFEQAARIGSPAVQVTAYAAAALEQNEVLQAQKAAPTKDDYAKVTTLADKALAINPSDALANFAEGIGLAGEYVADGKKDATVRGQALAALTKAKGEAQASGSAALASNIDAFIKSTLP